MADSTGFRIGRIGRIELRADMTWVLVAVSLGAGWASPRGFPLSIGLFVANVLLFFCSVVLHELAHVAVLDRLGMSPRYVTLWGFGGYIKLSRKARTPGAWALINAAGPLASALLGMALLIVTPLTPAGLSRDVVAYWARLNLFLAALNALPVYWFDGCDLLQAALWRLTGDRARGQAIATRVGLVAAVLLMVGAFAPGATFGVVSPFIIAFIGLFEAAAAAAAIRRPTQPSTDSEDPQPSSLGMAVSRSSRFSLHEPVPHRQTSAQ